MVGLVVEVVDFLALVPDHRDNLVVFLVGYRYIDNMSSIVMLLVTSIKLVHFSVKCGYIPVFVHIYK